MRIPFLPPGALSAEQRALYDDMRSGIERNWWRRRESISGRYGMISD